MLSDSEKIVLQHWRTVRANALHAHAQLDAHAPGVEHAMPDLVAKCDAAIAELEAKAALP